MKPPHLSRLHKQVENDVFNALEPSTQGIYKRQWSQFSLFISQYLDKKKYEASNQDLALYVAHLHNTGIKSGTIRGHLSAISFYYNTKGLATPTESFTISKLLTAYDKKDPPIKTRSSITLQILELLLVPLRSRVYSTFEKKMLTSVFTLMYYAILRISEVTYTPKNTHNLHAKQITINKYSQQKYMTISFTSFKHKKPGSKPITITQPSSGICPIKAYSDYCQLRPLKHQSAFVFMDGSPLTPRYIRSTLQHLVQMIDLDPDHYNTHSFRFGRATDMARLGYTDIQIAMAGRWSSTAYKKYIKPYIIVI